MPVAKITYYDFSDLYYAGFFAEGFLRLQEKSEHDFCVSKSVPVEIADLELPTWINSRKPPSTSVFRYEDAGQNFLFCIDANDHNGHNPALPHTYPGYHIPLIERVKVYFKVNYKEDVIAANPLVSPYADRIVPIPLVYPVKVSKSRHFLPNLNPLSGHKWSLSAIKRRRRHLQQLLPLQEYRRLRQLPRDLDVFFLTTIYTSENHEEINAWRLAVLEAISAYSHLKTQIGFVSNDDNLPRPFARFQFKPLPFEEYMSHLARSKIGLYTRGTFGALSFKFGQYFALGKAVVGEPLLNNSQNMYAYDHFSEQFNYTEPAEIADRIAELVADPVQLRQLTESNIATFEQHFTPLAVAELILDRLAQKSALAIENHGLTR
jgi:hypothetical protein